MVRADVLRSAVLSLLFLSILVGVWHIATLPKETTASAASSEYARLMGRGKASIAPLRAGANVVNLRSQT